MRESIICQSCGAELYRTEDCGTEADGKTSGDFCINCYKEGAFTNPDMTLRDMLEKVAFEASERLFLSSKKSMDVAWNLVPHLRRWKKV